MKLCSMCRERRLVDMPHVGGSGRSRVIDVTFNHAREQREILNEVPQEQIVEEEAQVPVSTTPEQLKRYCMESVQSTSDQNKRRVFLAFSRMIDENVELKKEVRELQRKLRNATVESTVTKSTSEGETEAEDSVNEAGDL